MERFLRNRRYFNKGETYQIRDYLFPGGFFMGETCIVTVTPLAAVKSSNSTVLCRNGDKTLRH